MKLFLVALLTSMVMGGVMYANAEHSAAPVVAKAAADRQAVLAQIMEE